MYYNKCLISTLVFVCTVRATYDCCTVAVFVITWMLKGILGLDSVSVNLIVSIKYKQLGLTVALDYSQPALSHVNTSHVYNFHL